MATKDYERAIVIPPSDAFVQDTRSNYIPLPLVFHDKYGIAVPTERSHFDLNWHQQRESLERENSYRLPLNLFTVFANHLREGIQGKIKVYDGKGNIVNNSRIDRILDEIYGIRDPWRAEFFDDYYLEKEDGLYVRYNKINTNGKPEEVTEKLEGCLMKDEAPGIDLSDWLERATSQGLPPKDVKKGSLWYWHPIDGSVAWFVAFSVRADLDCSRDPRNSDSALGVRAAKIFRIK